MKKTTLKNRMKKSELYVVYVDADLTTMQQRWLAYGDGAPRIYAKHALDCRILDTTPICTTWHSAYQRLCNGKGPVMVPLSMLTVTPARIRRWAHSQREVTPEVVTEYANRIGLADAPDSRAVAFAKHNVTVEIRFWIAAHPHGTLGEMLAWLESVRDQCDYFDDEDVIADHVDELTSEAVDYFSSWGELSEPVDGDEPATFGYRRDYLDEDINSVEELYDSLGGDVVVAELAEMPELAAC